MNLKTTIKKIASDIKDHPVADGLVALLLIAFASGSVFWLARPKGAPVAIIPETVNEARISPLKNISIEARSAIVFDLENQEVLYEKDADRVLPLASLTKIMTALTARELIPDYTVVSIDPTFLEEEGDSGLRARERFTLKNLLDFSLITSSNDGARAVASVAGAFHYDTNYDRGRIAFIETMNEQAQKLNLSRTKFWNETGLDLDEIQSGGYGSARDVSNLFAYVIKYHPDLLEATQADELSVASLNSKTHTAQNTNTIINQIQGIFASKTGFTDLAGGNLIIAFNDGLRHPIVIVVLGSSFEGRFSDVLTLSEAVRAHIAQITNETLLAKAEEK